MEEYDSIVKYIISKLEELKDSETGEKIVEKVYTKNELFNTKDEKLPDIFILMKDGYRAVAYNKIDGRSIFMPPIHGKILRPADHNIDSIFIAYGKSIVNKQLDNKIKTWDVVPAVLHALGIKTSFLDLDGKIIEDIFMTKPPTTTTSKTELNRLPKIIRKLKERGIL